MSDEEKPTSKKKRGRPPKKKKDSEVTPLSSTPQIVTEQDAYTILGNYFDAIAAEKQLAAEKRLNERLEKAFFQEETNLTPHLNNLEHQMGEILEDYIVVGHTYDGNRIKIVKATKPKDLDGLREAAKQVVIPFLMGDRVQEEQDGF